MVALPDTLVGTDSHTTMINGLGVLGWGVGGIEAEAVMLGQPLSMLMPEVIGFEMTGRLPPGATATDLVLTVTQILRKEGVVGKFVEYFGPGAAAMTVPDRATISNMAPEYGATAGFFPIDAATLDYLRLTGRSSSEVELVERYAKEQQLFWTAATPPARYTKTLSLDLGSIEPCLAGPKRPQDRVVLGAVKESFGRSLAAPVAERGFGLTPQEAARTAPVQLDGGKAGPAIGHGAVVIAAITSCTNTSNPSVMLAAGLLAKKAVARGLRTPPHVKTSLSPGSRVVIDYLAEAGLDKPLAALGFDNTGFGCMTCIGNSGPLPEPVAKAVADGNLVAAAVLSGNRNFEGRINPLVKANYLASPPLVVAYALAGTVQTDLVREPLGLGSDGRPVYLKEIWPSEAEIDAAMAAAVQSDMFRKRYADVFTANPKWNEIPVRRGRPVRVGAGEHLCPGAAVPDRPVGGALARRADPRGPGPAGPGRLGDDGPHLAGGLDRRHSPAGKYLVERGVSAGRFQQLRRRRGNDRVMTRGTFANIRLRNLLAPGTEGGVTRHLPDGKPMPDLRRGDAL